MTAADMNPLSTYPGEAASRKEQGRHRIERRIGIALLLGVLAVGALNLLGVRRTTVQATGGGFELTVSYASVSRPGLATPWSVRIRSPGGFNGPVVMTTTSSYFEIYDENGFDPDPQEATADGEMTVWEFAPPPGDVLTVSFDARIEPTFHVGRSARTSVLVDGEPVVSVTYRTVVMP